MKPKHKEKKGNKILFKKRKKNAKPWEVERGESLYRTAMAVPVKVVLWFVMFLLNFVVYSIDDGVIKIRFNYKISCSWKSNC